MRRGGGLHTCFAHASQHPQPTEAMASASALAGAFTTLGVAANKTAKRTNVVAKKVRPRIIPPAMDGRLGDVIRRLSRRETRREDARAIGRGAARSARRSASRPARSIPARGVIETDACAPSRSLDPAPLGPVFLHSLQASDTLAVGFPLRDADRDLNAPPPIPPPARSAGFLRALRGSLRQA